MMTDNYHIVLKAVPQSDGDACSMRELFPNAEERFERVGYRLTADRCMEDIWKPVFRFQCESASSALAIVCLLSNSFDWRVSGMTLQDEGQIAALARFHVQRFLIADRFVQMAGVDSTGNPPEYKPRRYDKLPCPGPTDYRGAPVRYHEWCHDQWRYHLRSLAALESILQARPATRDLCVDGRTVSRRRRSLRGGTQL